MTSPLIRRATMADFAAILELAEHLDAPQREALPDRFQKPEGEIRSRDRTAKLIADPDTFLEVAELEGRIVGIINAGIEPMPDFPQKRRLRSAKVRGIVVLPEFRRRGIATALMEALTAWARAKQADEILLSVYDFNQPAAAFFAALGFAPLSHRLVRRLTRVDG
ncbi:MAG: GNAT family N-acetyltransferase [candidate division WOR-3 bacterium]